MALAFSRSLTASGSRYAPSAKVDAAVRRAERMQPVRRDRKAERGQARPCHAGIGDGQHDMVEGLCRTNQGGSFSSLRGLQQKYSRIKANSRGVSAFARLGDRRRLCRLVRCGVAGTIMHLSRESPMTRQPAVRGRATGTSAMDHETSAVQAEFTGSAPPAVGEAHAGVLPLTRLRAHPHRDGRLASPGEWRGPHNGARGREPAGPRRRGGPADARRFPKRADADLSRHKAGARHAGPDHPDTCQRRPPTMSTL